MAKSDTVYNDFNPSSATLAPLAADYVKANDIAGKALDKVREATFKALVAGGKVDKASEERFRVGRRWGQWSWWIASEKKSAKSDGMDL